MSNGEKRKLRVDIERRWNSTTIIIRNVDEASFDDAYCFIEKLYDRAQKLDDKNLALKSTNPFWIQTEDRRIISDLVSQSSHRVAISLLDAYPSSKTTSEIVLETGLTKTSVRHIAYGRKASVVDYFTAEKGLYKLTDDGLRWVIKDVVPFLTEQSGFAESPEKKV